MSEKPPKLKSTDPTEIARENGWTVPALLTVTLGKELFPEKLSSPEHQAEFDRRMAAGESPEKILTDLAQRKKSGNTGRPLVPLGTEPSDAEALNTLHPKIPAKSLFNQKVARQAAGMVESDKARIAREERQRLSAQNDTNSIKFEPNSTRLGHNSEAASEDISPGLAVEPHESVSELKFAEGDDELVEEPFELTPEMELRPKISREQVAKNPRAGLKEEVPLKESALYRRYRKSLELLASNIEKETFEVPSGMDNPPVYLDRVAKKIEALKNSNNPDDFAGVKADFEALVGTLRHQNKIAGATKEAFAKLMDQIPENEKDSLATPKEEPVAGLDLNSSANAVSADFGIPESLRPDTERSFSTPEPATAKTASSRRGAPDNFDVKNSNEGVRGKQKSPEPEKEPYSPYQEHRKAFDFLERELLKGTFEVPSGIEHSDLDLNALAAEIERLKKSSNPEELKNVQKGLGALRTVLRNQDRRELEQQWGQVIDEILEEQPSADVVKIDNSAHSPSVAPKIARIKLRPVRLKNQPASSTPAVEGKKVDSPLESEGYSKHDPFDPWTADAFEAFQKAQEKPRDEKVEDLRKLIFDYYGREHSVEPDYLEPNDVTINGLDTSTPPPTPKPLAPTGSEPVQTQSAAVDPKLAPGSEPQIPADFSMNFTTERPNEAESTASGVDVTTEYPGGLYDAARWTGRGAPLESRNPYKDRPISEIVPPLWLRKKREGTAPIATAQRMEDVPPPPQAIDLKPESPVTPRPVNRAPKSRGVTKAPRKGGIRKALTFALTLLTGLTGESKKLDAFEYENSDSDKIVKIIRDIESGGSSDPYTVVAPDGGWGAYGWSANNFEDWAKQYGLNPNDRSPKNQDRLARARVTDLLQQGNSSDEIYARWNGATYRNGTYVPNNPAYMKKVRRLEANFTGATIQPLEQVAEKSVAKAEIPAPKPQKAEKVSRPKVETAAERNLREEKITADLNRAQLAKAEAIAAEAATEAAQRNTPPAVSGVNVPSVGLDLADLVPTRLAPVEIAPLKQPENFKAFVAEHSSEAHIYADKDGEKLFVYGGTTKEQGDLMAKFFEDSNIAPGTVVYGTDVESKKMIPFTRDVGGSLTVLSPVKRGFLGFHLFGYKKPPQPEQFASLVQ